MKDAALTVVVRGNMIAQAGLESREIGVDIHRQIVTLRGVVDTATQKELAEQATRETKGVQDVVNAISVKPMQLQGH